MQGMLSFIPVASFRGYAARLLSLIFEHTRLPAVSFIKDDPMSCMSYF